MPLGIQNVGWLNLNSERAYPLAEWATSRDESGELRLPDDVIVSLYLSVHAGLEVSPDNFFLLEIAVDSIGISLAIGYDDGSGAVEAANTAVAFDGHEEFGTYSLQGVGDFFDIQGRVTLGRLEALQAVPVGVFVFTKEGGALDSDVVRPQLRGVSSIVVVNGSERSAPLTGVIELSAGSNYQITVTDADSSAPRVTLNAIRGEGLNKDCACVDIEHAAAPCIKTINGLTPGPTRNIDLFGTAGVAVRSSGSAVTMENLHSKPCCRCPTLENLKDLLRKLTAGANVTDGVFRRLDGAVARLELTVLGSRLNDQGCEEC